MFRRAAVAISSLVAALAQAPQQVASDPLGRTSPYGCVLGFLRSAESGDLTRAGEYLDFRGSQNAREELARQLKTVLDRGLSEPVTNLSRSPEGKADDKLPPAREFIAVAGNLRIELQRVERRNEAAIWLFSPQSLRGVPAAFEEIGSPEFTHSLPRFLTQVRIFSIPLWRWLSVMIVLLCALVLASLVTRALIPLLQPLLRRLTGREDEQRLKSLRGPIRLVLLASAMLVPASFAISLLARQVWRAGAGIIAIIGLAWLAIQFGDIVTDLNTRKWIRLRQPGRIAMLTLISRVYKILVVLIAAVVLLHRSGVNVTAMIAGLGIGGIALALAAQKTLENAFGGVNIIMTEAIRVGDFCKVSGQLGTVEDIGLSVIRLRTLDRTVLAVPNSQLSQLSLENYTLRDKFWFHQVFGLRFDTTASQMRTILQGIEQILHDDPRLESSSSRVRFMGFSKSSLTLEIFAYVMAASFEDFLKVQQELLLSVLNVIESAGTCVAVPLVMSAPESESPEMVGTADGGQAGRN